MEGKNGVAISGGSLWLTKDIVYLSILGPVLMIALAEWLLWLFAFLYCLARVFRKAECRSVRLLTMVMMFLFVLLRLAFVPIMVVILPLPSILAQHFPRRMVYAFQSVALCAFIILLLLPWLLCVYRVVTNSLGRSTRVKEVLDDRTAPKVMVIMPVYKEDPETLVKALNSVVTSDYPTYCIHMFLSYDGSNVDEWYLRVIHELGIPLSLKSYPQSIDVTYKGVRVTVSRFGHGGKRHCQKLTFKLINKIYADYIKTHDNVFLLFMDSDCVLDKFCIQNLMYDMELKPGCKNNMLAMTGIITSTTEKNSILTILQDVEYLHGQLFERSVESACGALTCLPGALTILRLSAFRRMAKYYFEDSVDQCEDFFDYAKCHLGEDRWLTHLLMIGAKERYQIQLCTTAFCKTVAVQTFMSLLKQRRRWFLGFITNETCLLTDIRLWKKYPLLCLARFFQDTIRTTGPLLFGLAIVASTTSSKFNDIPVGFIGVTFGLNYLLMFYFGAKLRRYKAWLYPAMFLLNPFLSWLYIVYGVFTARRRTWGGPRADASEAEENKIAEEATEQVKVHAPEGKILAGRQLISSHHVNDSESDIALFQMMGPAVKGPRIHLHQYYASEASEMSTTSLSLPLPLPQVVGALVEEQKTASYDCGKQGLFCDIPPKEAHLKGDCHDASEILLPQYYPEFASLELRAPPPTPTQEHRLLRAETVPRIGARIASERRASSSERDSSSSSMPGVPRRRAEFDMPRSRTSGRGF